MDRLKNIARQFAKSREVTELRAFGSGNINDTFLVTIADVTDPHFVLQRINTHVFQQPALVMRNMRIFTEHMHQKLQSETAPAGRRWVVPRVLLTIEDRDHWIEPDGSYWRAISFIDDSQTLDIIQDIQHGWEVGYALGRFHHLISDLDPDKLADTLEGFHITPQYLEYYHQVLSTHTPTVNREVDYCLQFVRERQEWARVLEDAKTSGKLPLRPIHGDPKVNNVMICTTTQQAIGAIDLDTVKPGLVHYDIGDCLRSGCNPLGEETKEWERVHFDTQMCRAILDGYLSQARGFLGAHDYEYMFDAMRLIAFELGLRFFTDYLAGNVYFKVKYPTHNLDRALVQFKLTESIEAQELVIRSIIEELRG
ncbi:aminoglycoside phosphotransferase family protein [Chamaesiphon sp. GL140_3_metabinner_50]|uniref:phosphotransferase enzyme family protein n=1 Tax=Chamaesiphon sp. GL140_3_metabinner_50 TaxID=2970812 RepID=UPI0025E07689|nr:aminoglycoside phosphotransferase family protein [Chamaesiphon sp. GL140_3_metabinner_50]